LRVIHEGRNNPEDDDSNPGRFPRIKRLGRSLLSGFNLDAPQINYREFDPMLRRIAMESEEKKNVQLIADNIDRFIDNPPNVVNQGTIPNEYFKHFRVVHNLSEQTRHRENVSVVVVDRYQPLKQADDTTETNSSFEAVMAHEDNFPEECSRNYVIRKYGPAQYYQDGSSRRKVVEFSISPDNATERMGWRTYTTVNDGIAEGLRGKWDYDLQSIKTMDTQDLTGQKTPSQVGVEINDIFDAIRASYSQPNSSL
jgi:hypothetical protein